MYESKQENPCGLDGFAFLEFSGPDKAAVERQFLDMGFVQIAAHRSADISLFQQGHIKFIVNGEANTQAAAHARVHGAGACAMGFQVKDAEKALSHALNHGAELFVPEGRVNYQLPAIKAIGGSVIYFVEDIQTTFADEWHHFSVDTSGCGLKAIDHLTHNVHQGNMDQWAAFYEKLFNFSEIRFFDIKGQMTGLISRALASPCGKIKIPLNESKDSQSQIEEFLKDYQGEGIQHIALTASDIYHTIPCLMKNAVKFLDVPNTYYEMIGERVPWHQEPLDSLRDNRILIDGDKTADGGLLLQIFTENVFGPVFFEIIQRKGNEGFGEGNFQALFEAIERDQIRRGTLKSAKTE